MAYNDSGELPVSQNTYSLGGYTFELKVQTVHEPGEEDVVSVFAICRGPDGTRETQAVDYPEGTTVESWSVECNEKEASVYANVDYNIPGIPEFETGTFLTSNVYATGSGFTNYSAAGCPCFIGENGLIYVVSESRKRIECEFDDWAGGTYIRHRTSSFTVGNFQYTLFGKTAYYSVSPVGFRAENQPFSPPGFNVENPGLCAWATLFRADYTSGEQLIGRFAIDIREADTDSWNEPGDDGPPGTTLNVTVTGATAGSCTGTPADNNTVKGYGDGGDGGYGGGGGAGASTVIIYEFATSIAESVQQEAISRGPGTGGPGGKGGKGGDGCILIFY